MRGWQWKAILGVVGGATLFAAAVGAEQLAIAGVSLIVGSAMVFAWRVVGTWRRENQGLRAMLRAGGDPYAALPPAPQSETNGVSGTISLPERSGFVA